MHSVDEAIRLLAAAGRARFSPDRLIHQPVYEALNLVLGDDIISPVDVPPRANSAMDGYAYYQDDAEKAGFRLPVSQRIAAGQSPQPLLRHTCARIFTGAEIPEGADTVAMQEDCRVEGESLWIADPPQQGANIRPQGQDIRKGQVILRRGHRLRPQELGLLASVGAEGIPVCRPLRVAVFSTGDELVEPGKALAPGQIFNSNRGTLHGLLAAWGMEMVDMGICRDRPAEVEAMLARGAENGDVIVTSGGVSVGEEDHIKAAVAKLGTLDLWKIAIKPGKPLAFGEVNGKPIIGLPGNPASVFVTALILLRPFLLAMSGRDQVLPRASRESALFSRKAVAREEYLRARRTADGVEIFPNQSSGMLSAACWGDGLIVQNIGQVIGEGEAVDFFPYSEFF